jgi:phage/plasmid-associated DNA primase
MLPFLTNFTIDVSKIPSYDEFAKPFTVQIDRGLCEMLMDGTNPNITDVMISNFKNNVLPFIAPDGNLTIHHNNRHGLGRFYSDADKSPVCHSKFIKHTIFKYMGWLDVDMVKGHPSIIRLLINRNGGDTDCFDRVVFHFDEIVAEIASYYKKECGVDLDADNIKYYFNLTIYGGGYSTWKKKLADVKDAEKYGYAIKVIPDETPIHHYMKEFKDQCVEIMDKVFKHNPVIAERVSAGKNTIYEKKCATISYFLGIIENHIVHFVYKYLVRKGGIISQQCLPEMDGICMPRIGGVDYDAIIADINSVLSPIEISFKIKPYGKFVLQEMIEKRQLLPHPQVEEIVEIEPITDDDSVSVVSDTKSVVNVKTMSLEELIQQKKNEEKTAKEKAKEEAKKVKEDAKKAKEEVKKAEKEVKEAEKETKEEAKIREKKAKEAEKKAKEEEKKAKEEMKEAEKQAREEEKKAKEEIKKREKEDELRIKGLKQNEEKRRKDNEMNIDHCMNKDINWDLSEAVFAKQLKEVCFSDSPVITTGKDREMEAYMFNGVFWLPLSLHNAELQKKRFDDLYEFYSNALYDETDNISKKLYLHLEGFIKSLNSNKTRENVIKIFKKDHYEEKVIWNNNLELFVFDDKIYDLSKGCFVKPNKKDYITMTCGYSYDIPFGNKGGESYEEIRADIVEIFKTIIDDDAENTHILKVLSSFLIQINKEEKAYFWLGSGRNGKGTITTICSNALGKYWGELHTEYYTTAKQRADEPNQNLYNCRNSRVLNTSEIAGENSRGGKTMFLNDNFCRITGNDVINARELGTKNVASFKAGKVLIQLNNMPTFSNLSKSTSNINERVEIHNFKYSFTNKTELLEAEPWKYKMVNTSIKTKFQSPTYRRVMIDILFENYKEYLKNGLAVPTSIVAYTNKYLSGETISGLIENSFCRGVGTDRIHLGKIQFVYENERTKKIGVNKLQKELKDNGFDVRQTAPGCFYLYGFKEEEMELEININESIED